jgi:hypothetical protein
MIINVKSKQKTITLKTTFFDLLVDIHPILIFSLNLFQKIGFVTIGFEPNCYIQLRFASYHTLIYFQGAYLD